ncbi:hypothetical protein BDK51DRAFT_39204 [Blyttiomyces helicus]|uniref:Uncharacterized protein n=1 Tax=Blyttiomyces helicus TaxID=388810 RepID=A0A4P9W4G6_9FUNG|nr:hypothetical protein BDK51DRAFT_39204 [Blyttiomyces helicus]|eukprot:RKO86792.1 hypothetical protein BDK51DRAFT_39204 [Blyttiomyces helicus]
MDAKLQAPSQLCSLDTTLFPPSPNPSPPGASEYRCGGGYWGQGAPAAASTRQHLTKNQVKIDKFIINEFGSAQRARLLKTNSRRCHRPPPPLASGKGQLSCEEPSVILLASEFSPVLPTVTKDSSPDKLGDSRVIMLPKGPKKIAAKDDEKYHWSFYMWLLTHMRPKDFVCTSQWDPELVRLWRLECECTSMLSSVRHIPRTTTESASASKPSRPILACASSLAGLSSRPTGQRIGPASVFHRRAYHRHCLHAWRYKMQKEIKFAVEEVENDHSADCYHLAHIVPNRYDTRETVRMNLADIDSFYGCNYQRPTWEIRYDFGGPDTSLRPSLATRAPALCQSTVVATVPAEDSDGNPEDFFETTDCSSEGGEEEEEQEVEVVVVKSDEERGGERVEKDKEGTGATAEADAGGEKRKEPTAGADAIGGEEGSSGQVPPTPSAETVKGKRKEKEVDSAAPMEVNEPVSKAEKARKTNSDANKGEADKGAAAGTRRTRSSKSGSPQPKARLTAPKKAEVRPSSSP